MSIVNEIESNLRVHVHCYLLFYAGTKKQKDRLVLSNACVRPASASVDLLGQDGQVPVAIMLCQCPAPGVYLVLSGAIKLHSLWLCPALEYGSSW